MAKLDLEKVLAGKWEDGKRPKDLFERTIAEDPARHVDEIIRGLSSDERRVQNGCAELSSLLSEAHPELLAPHVDLYVRNLDAKEAVLRWEAACTLGNLAKIDRSKKVLGVVPKLVALLEHESIVLQGHAVRALAKIVRVHPESAGKILSALLRAEPHFPESRVGYLVEAMESFAGLPSAASKAEAFARKFEGSEMRPVATKAKRALKAIAKAKPKG